MWTFSIIAFLVFLVLWGLAWRNQIKMAFGIFIGIVVGVIAAMAMGPIEIEEIPIWLPATPFAVVAIALLIFGILAWVVGDRES